MNMACSSEHAAAGLGNRSCSIKTDSVVLMHTDGPADEYHNVKNRRC